MDQTKKHDDNLDGMVDDGQLGNATEQAERSAVGYADNLATQLRKGYLAYCVLLICAEQRYTSEIIAELQTAELVVVEGTIYPLLNRLQKDGLLQYEWQESEQGPPRKYYFLTSYGQSVIDELKAHIDTLNTTLKKLEKGAEK